MKCPDCEGKGYITIRVSKWCNNINDCPSCNGTGTKPEPEQDERIREAFEKTKSMSQMEWDTEICSYRYTGASVILGLDRQDRMNHDLNTFKSGYTYRNAEIEALKAEIESMRCCGNCIYRFTCSSKENDTLGDGSCDQWKRKAK